MAEETGADVNLKLAGQEISLKNVKSINTIFTILGAAGTGFLIYLGVTHANETKDAAKEFVGAMKEQTQALRENNCLTTFPIEKREANAELCKRLSR